MSRKQTRYAVAIVFTLLLLPGCSTPDAAIRVEVDLRIEQLPDAGFAVEDRGAVSIAYQMTVRNRSSDVISLRSVEMQTDARSPYTLRNEPAAINETIGPGEEALVTFTMWSYSRGQRSKARRMVRVIGVAHFDGTKGSFKKAFTQSFREP